MNKKYQNDLYNTAKQMADNWNDHEYQRFINSINDGRVYTPKYKTHENFLKRDE